MVAQQSKAVVDHFDSVAFALVASGHAELRVARLASPSHLGHSLALGERLHICLCRSLSAPLGLLLVRLQLGAARLHLRRLVAGKQLLLDGHFASICFWFGGFFLLFS